MLAEQTRPGQNHLQWLLFMVHTDQYACFLLLVNVY